MLQLRFTETNVTPDVIETQVPLVLWWLTMTAEFF